MSPAVPASAVAPRTRLEALEAELDQAMAEQELVVVCWELGCTMHRLRHWDTEEWVSRPQQPGYRRYSHGICARHYPGYQRQIDELLSEYSRREAALSTAVAAT
jgi:hypothetical protein